MADDELDGARPAVPSRIPSKEEIDRAKKWMLIRFRQLLRGAVMTEKVNRWLSGELPQYSFRVEIMLTQEAKDYLNNPANLPLLEKETLA